MSVHLVRQIEQLKKMILTLGTRVEEAVQDAITALASRDAELAQQVIARDSEIDLMEIDVEEECLKTLALHQPVAFDLRYVVAVLKINSDLERIADLATNVSEQVTFLVMEPRIESIPVDLCSMMKRVQSMLRRCLDALIHVDVETAQSVRQTDDEVDQIHRAMYVFLEERVAADASQYPQLIHYLTISRQFERMADHAVNIAEDVLYLARGEIMRHERIPREPAAR